MYTECCCCARVEQGSVGMLEELGKFSDVLPPGCHCLSLTKSLKGALSLKAQYLWAEVKSITSDQADVTCSLGIMYRVMPESCHLAFYRLARADDQIRNFVVGSVRPLIITKTLDQLFEERDELSNVVKEELGVKMSEFGYEILDVLFVNLNVQGRVRQSMNEQMLQKFNRELAEVQQKTENIRQITLSKANVEVERLHGVGTAEARKVLAGALSAGRNFGKKEELHKALPLNDSEVSMSHGGIDVARYIAEEAVIEARQSSRSESGASEETEVMAMMLMMQYYDMLRDIKKTLTYFMPLGTSSSSTEDSAVMGNSVVSHQSTAKDRVVIPKGPMQ